MSEKLSNNLGLPRKNAPPTPDNVNALNNGLTSVVWGHPQAEKPWTFYEVIEKYLGPWGGVGYPLSYGKFYCKLFNDNSELSKNSQTKRWVHQTTILLQTDLRDYIISRFKAGTLNRVTEADIRKAAFESHAKAYADGGLATVCMVAPELVPIILKLPIREFLPESGNALASWNELIETIALVTPQYIGTAIAVTMPAHSQIFTIAHQRDRQQMLQEQNLAANLQRLQRVIRAGHYDRMDLLEALTTRINATSYPDPSLARMAKQIIDDANARKRKIARTVRKLVSQNPEKSPMLDKAQPGWQRW